MKCVPVSKLSSDALIKELAAATRPCWPRLRKGACT